MSTTQTEQWYMAGTEGTGEYLVVADSAVAKVGFRCLVDGAFRVRVEPKTGAASDVLAKLLTEDKGWKQPDGWHLRFSQVYTDPAAAIAAIEKVVAALKRRGDVQRQPGKRLWRAQLLA